MGKGKDDADLRKEVELTEHQDSIEAVCRQYETDGDKGLSSAVAEEVSYVSRCLFISLSLIYVWPGINDHLSA